MPVLFNFKMPDFQDAHKRKIHAAKPKIGALRRKIWRKRRLLSVSAHHLDLAEA